MIIEEYNAKTLLRSSYPSLFAWMEYALNPYQGCAHDCRYCDGKSERYRMHAEHFPELLPKYHLLYGNNDRYGKPNPRTAKRLNLAKPELKAYRFIYESGLDYTAKRFIPTGRIHSNLRVSEVLMRAAYLKGTFLGGWQEAKGLTRGAMILEKLEHDVFELSREQLNRIGFPLETYPYLTELFLDDYSKSLIELEKQAYQKSLAVKCDSYSA